MKLAKKMQRAIKRLNQEYVSESQQYKKTLDNWAVVVVNLYREKRHYKKECGILKRQMSDLKAENERLLTLVHPSESESDSESKDSIASTPPMSTYDHSEERIADSNSS